MRAIDDATQRLTKQLMDEGKLIESGFALFAHYVIPKDASQTQIREMRLAWMASAEHLFSSIMSALEPGEEPSDADMKRTDLIVKELDYWRAFLSERVHPVQGSA